MNKIEREARNEAMRQLVDQGWTLARIAQEYGLTRQGVRRVVGSVGHRTPVRDLIEKHKPLIEKMWREGTSFVKIAHMIGADPSTLKRYFNKPSSYYNVERHGMTGYAKGCRCNVCREANNEKRRLYLQRRRERGLCATCGAQSTSWSCDACKAKEKNEDA
jgi:AraC-like DNA-binding protein